LTGIKTRLQARRYARATVAILDIDRFRDTNNRDGHLAGDAVLQAVAANAAPLQHDGVELPATVSVGAAAFPQHAREAEALRKQADAAMYVAKNAGGNRYAFQRPSA
jgi:GGDEF domain-containing protein